MTSPSTTTETMLRMGTIAVQGLDVFFGEEVDT